MKTKMRQSQALKEKPPLAGGLEGKLQRDFLAATTHFGKERDKACGYWHGVSLFPASLGRRERNGGAGDVAKLDASFAETATCGHSNKPRTLHPCGFRGEGSFDGGLFGGGNFGFFARGVPLQLHARKRRNFNHPSVHGLGQHALKGFHLHDCRISRNEFPVVAFRCRALRNIFLCMKVSHRSRGIDLIFPKKVLNMSPMQGASGCRQVGNSPRVKPRRNPPPSCFTMGRGFRGLFNRAIKSKNFCAFRVERRVPSESGVFRFPVTGNLHANPPKRRSSAFVKRGHARV